MSNGDRNFTIDAVIRLLGALTGFGTIVFRLVQTIRKRKRPPTTPGKPGDGYADDQPTERWR